MKYLSIDLETYSPLPLGKVGVHRYAAHQDADIICAVVGKDTELWYPGLPVPQIILDAVQDDDLKLTAYNAQFERTMWEEVLVPKYNWPSVPLDKWYCTAAQCASLALPGRLDRVGEFLELDDQKDTVGKNVMLRLCQPDKKTGLRPEPKPGELHTVYEYCKQDVRAEIAIANSTRKMQPEEYQVWLLDQKINSRGIYVDSEFAEAALEFWENYLLNLNARVQELTGGILGTQVGELKKWLGTEGFNISSLARPVVRDQLKRPDLPANVREVLRLRLEIGSTAVKKYDAFVRCSGPDSRIRGTLFYHGASTGRWAGRLIQPQNMPRGILKNQEQITAAMSLVKDNDVDILRFFWDDLGDVLGSLCRPTIKASPGNKLVVADYSQIEARCVAWLSGQSDMLDDFVNKRDLYVSMASRIYKKDKAEVNSRERAVGKSAVLGCGYGMGWKRFKGSVKEVTGVIVTDDEAKQAVYGYRHNASKVCELWQELETMFAACVETGQQQHAKAITAYMDGKWTFLVLPSGRELAYYKCRMVPGTYGDQIEFMGVDRQNGKPVREQTYGGKILENIASGICRDLLTNAMFNLEKEGYKVVTTVHDEIVTEVPEDFGSAQEMEQIMSRTPAWANGFPVGSEGYEAIHYRK